MGLTDLRAAASQEDGQPSVRKRKPASAAWAERAENFDATFRPNIRLARMGRYTRVAEQSKIAFAMDSANALMSYPRIDPNICGFRGRSLHRLLYTHIVIDIDSDISLAEFVLATGVEPKTLTGTLLPNGRLKRPHALIELLYPVSVEAKSNSQILQSRFFSAVAGKLCDALRQCGYDADAGQKTTTKNPDSGYWDVQKGLDKTWTLTELIDATADISNVIAFPQVQPDAASRVKYQDGVVVRMRRPVTPADGVGRNVGVFDHVRHLAYASCDAFGSYESGYDFCLREAEAFNASHQAPLGQTEIRAIAKSITNFILTRYCPGKPEYNEGAAAHLINPLMSKREKMQIGAHYSAYVKAEKTSEKVAAAKSELKAAGEDITKKAVARLTGLALNTVRKYWQGNSRKIAASISKLKSGCANIPTVSSVELTVVGGAISPYQNNDTQKEQKSNVTYGCQLQWGEAFVWEEERDAEYIMPPEAEDLEAYRLTRQVFARQRACSLHGEGNFIESYGG